MANRELIEICDRIDSYVISNSSNITEFTKKNLKSLLISGANPSSNNFKERFPDEYHLYQELK